jgi:release factor glutamine methyltransferase
VTRKVVALLRAAGCVFAEEEAGLIIATARTPDELSAMVERRVAGLPLEQVLGWAEFCGLRIAVDPGVFVPRRRTEFLVQQALLVAPPGPVVVDLCCGAGAIGAALAAAVDRAEVHAADIDPAAVSCARRNVPGHVYQGDLYQPLPASLRGRVGLLVANVPYVPTGEIGFLPAEARAHEPRAALDGGPDGLDVLRRVAAGAPAWLAPGGHLLIETSGRQVPAACAAFAASGLTVRVASSDELPVAAGGQSYPAAAGGQSYGATVVIGTRLPFGRAREVLASGQHEPGDQDGDVRGSGGLAGDQGQHSQREPGGEHGPDEQPQRAAAADPGRNQDHGEQQFQRWQRPSPPPPSPLSRQRLGADADAVRVVVAAAFSPGLLDQVGVGLRAAPWGAQLGVGGAGLGVPGQVAAVDAVGVGGGGDRPPGGPDGLVVQVGAFGQAEDLKRVRAHGRLQVRRCHRDPGSSARARRARPEGAGSPAARLAGEG